MGGTEITKVWLCSEFHMVSQDWTDSVNASKIGVPQYIITTTVHQTQNDRTFCYSGGNSFNITNLNHFGKLIIAADSVIMELSPTSP